MKTLVMLPFAVMCCILSPSLGAVIDREMAAIPNVLIKNTVEMGVQDFANSFPAELSEILMKNSDNANGERDIKSSVQKDIDKYMSTLSFGEEDNEISYLNDIQKQTPQDSAKKQKAKTTCSWNANTYKCCHSLQVNNTACVAAKVDNEEVNFSLDIDGTTVWKKSVSYKGTLENIVREALELVTGNIGSMDTKNFDPESISNDDEPVEDGSDRIEIVDGKNAMLNETTGYKRLRCYWRGRVGRCCWRITIFGRTFTACFVFLYLPPLRIRLYLQINGRSVWSHYFGIGSRGVQICRSILRVNVCFRVSMYFNRGYVRACFGLYGRLWIWRVTLPLGCFSHRLTLQEITAATTKKPDPFMAYKEIDNALFSAEELKENTDLKFEPQDFD